MAKKILIVDDDEDILDAVSLVLRDFGFTVETTDHAEETVEKVQDFRPDVIMLDVLMSGIDGRDICKKLKSTEPLKEIPVIMVSAHPSAKKKSIESGANDFLPKPFTVTDLVKKVEQYTH